MIKTPVSPEIAPATLEQLNTLNRLAELTLRNISGTHQTKGRRQRDLPIPGQADEHIVVAIYRPNMLMVRLEKDDSAIQNWSQATINTFSHSSHYYSSGEFRGPEVSPGHEVFTSEAAQRLTDKIVEAAQLSPLADNTAK